VARLLLVEDNEMSRDMLSRRLMKHGYEVMVAADGSEALQRIDTDRPDLILIDLGLPGMDGWEVTRRLRARAETQHIPIIALTAHAMAGDRERALSVGCNDYDIKPVNLARLESKIEALLGSGGRDTSADHTGGS
jgi:CheY-like chemotaxis protein